MTRTDRVLLALAVLSGGLLAQGPLRGAPDGVPACGKGCQPIQKYYDCVLETGYYHEKADCHACANGHCQNVAQNGLKCVRSDEPRKTKNLADVGLLCPCQNATRVQATGTVSDEDPWEENFLNKYWVCTDGTFAGSRVGADEAGDGGNRESNREGASGGAPGGGEETVGDAVGLPGSDLPPVPPGDSGETVPEFGGEAVIEGPGE